MPLCTVAWLSDAASQPPCMYKKGTFQALKKLAGSRHILNTNHFSSHLVAQTVRQIMPCYMETAISKIREVGEYMLPSFELKTDEKDNEISGSDLRTQAPAKDSQLVVVILYDSVFLLAFPKWVFQVVSGLCQCSQAKLL